MDLFTCHVDPNLTQLIHAKGCLARVSDRNRQKQVAELMRFIHKHATSSPAARGGGFQLRGPCILAGDFNSSIRLPYSSGCTSDQDYAAMAAQLEGFGLRDVYARGTHHATYGYTSPQETRLSPPRAWGTQAVDDHVFTTGVVVQQVRTISMYVPAPDPKPHCGSAQDQTQAQARPEERIPSNTAGSCSNKQTFTHISDHWGVAVTVALPGE